jgi:hypothetical protein
MCALLVLCFFSFAHAQVGQKVDLKWVYMSKDVVWTPPPKDPELPQYETSHADFAVFYPSGAFAGGLFAVGRYGKKGPIFIVPAEGFAVWRGSWARNSDGSIAVKSQIVYEDKVLHIPKEPLPTPMKEEHWLLQGTSQGRLAAVLKSPSEEYEPVLAMSELDSLNRLINFSPTP